MEYITVHKREGWGNPYTKSLGIDIRISIGRKITEEEEKEFYRITDEIQRMLVKNSMLMNSDYQQELKNERKELLSLFGDEKVYVVEIENGYDKSIPSPWFKVYTTKGPITIGWRKRVINIDWNESDIKALPTDLFPDEDVTMGGKFGESKKDQYIHAWGYEKAKEYLTKILQ
jgi:hypothetical protein